MPKTKQYGPAPILRIHVSTEGVLRVEGAVADARDRQAALGLTGRLMPAIRQFDKAVRREFSD